MGFLMCLGWKKKTKTNANQKKRKDRSVQIRDVSSSPVNPTRVMSRLEIPRSPLDRLEKFSYEELAIATNNFSERSFIGQGGFGAVYKGKIQSTGQDVAVKMLNGRGLQGSREFLVEVLMLSNMQHENIVKLFGYCTEDDHKIIVYEYMPHGSLDDHIHGLKPGQESLDLITRMKIALGTAKAIEHLHDKANHSVIYRDLKCANILLDHCFEAKLSDFGLAMLAEGADKVDVCTKIMGTHGYCAPEYLRTGKLTKPCDIYGFGVVLLEIITGRKAVSDTVFGSDHLLVNAIPPLFIQNKLEEIIDPTLSIKDSLTKTILRRVLRVAFTCLKEDGEARPLISEVVLALDFNVKCLESYDQKKTNDESSYRQIKKKNFTMRTLLDTIQEIEQEEVEEDGDVERKKAVADAKTWAEIWKVIWSIMEKNEKPKSLFPF